MVMKVTRMRVCDVCESDDGVCRYRITKLEGTAQRTVTTDLCATHGAEVEQAMDAAPQSRRGRKAGKPVVSLDEIKTKKKTPTKRSTPSKRTAAKR